MNHSITTLDSHEQSTALEIWTVFQRAYQVEADLVGSTDFPPLRRTVEDMQSSGFVFWGFRKGKVLAGVIEINELSKSLEICSLVVDPDFFRQGIAVQLMTYVLDVYKPATCVVETARANKPAIALYERMGFEIDRHWMTDFGIEKTGLIRKHKFIL